MTTILPIFPKDEKQADEIASFINALFAKRGHTQPVVESFIFLNGSFVVREIQQEMPK